MTSPLSPHDVVIVPKGAVGNARAFRLRVEEVQKEEVRRHNKVFVLVYGVEVTKAGETRRYFGRKISEFKVWLGPDDYHLAV